MPRDCSKNQAAVEQMRPTCHKRHIGMRNRIDKSWAYQCTALVIPFTAMLHQAVFYPHNCLLNQFGDEYTLTSVGLFLTRDPSLPWAVLAAFATYLAGSAKLIRLGVLPFLLGFLPLSLWIWDIPFAGRPICTHWHDGLLVLPLIGPVRSLHVYALSALLTTAFMLIRLSVQRARLLGDIVSHDRA